MADRVGSRFGCLRTTIAAALALGLAATIASPPRPWLVWNVSASAPRGLYFVRPWAQPARGDMVAARTPEPWRRLAAARHYLPSNVPLLKRVAAGAGDTVCARDGHVFVNGRWAAWQRPFDGQGRPMPAWNGCRTLAQGTLFLLMDARDSFDGRYFGPTYAPDIIGPARLLWAR